MNAGANCLPMDLIVLPNSGEDLVSRIENAYRLFFRGWNEDYVPLIVMCQNWRMDSEDLVPEDIIYFKLRRSVAGRKLSLGKTENFVILKDWNVRKVVVGSKYESEGGKEQG